MADEQKPTEKESATTTPQQQPEGASSRSIVALVLGLIGLFFCQPVGIAAWIIGSRERDAIANGESPQAGMGLATAGWILGIIDTILFVLSIIGAIIILILAITGVFTTTSGFNFQ